VTSIELGTKNNLFDRKLQIAASVYQIKWKGIQQGVTLPSCAIQFTDNLGNARSRGFDLQVSARPVAGLSLDLAVGYTDAEYTSTTQFAANRIIVSKGNSLGSEPWTVSVGAQYDFSNLYLRGDYLYTSRRTGVVPSEDPRNRGYDPENRPADAIHMVNLRGGAFIGDANVSLFVDNLFDKAPLRSRGHSGDTFLFTQTTVRPRTIGLTVSFRR
jgi:outer membrane receptor protein involved in Fe transport